MDDSIATTCSRCEAEIVVMTPAAYLNSTDDDLDFRLHASDRNAQLAIMTDDGAYTCPNCGKSDRLPRVQLGR